MGALVAVMLTAAAVIGVALLVAVTKAVGEITNALVRIDRGTEELRYRFDPDREWSKHKRSEERGDLGPFVGAPEGEGGHRCPSGGRPSMASTETGVRDQPS